MEIAEELGTAKSDQNSQDAVGSQSSGSTGSPNLSPAVQKEAASELLSKIGLSPMVLKNIQTQKAKILLGKRKLEAATEIVRKKVCRALAVTPGDLETEETKKAKDHDLLMDEIKERLPSASKVQKYQLLSLIPLRISLSSAASQFGVSRKLISRARMLRVEKGILPVQDFTRKSTVLESTKQLVRDFYCREDNCKILPGSRDCVRVSKGVYEQKRLLLSNLAELYASFRKEYPNEKIGITLFFSLRPKWCVFAGTAGTHLQCICQIHQNFELILHALGLKMHFKELIKLCVCDTKNRDCMLRICENCPTIDMVQEIIRSKITMPELLEIDDELSSDDETEFFEEPITVRQWKSTDGTELTVQVLQRSDLIEMAAKQLVNLISHDFVACSQRDYMQDLRKNLPPNKVVVAMDFSMNYNCLVQNAVQSYHWSPKQVTVHPTVIYYRDSQTNEIKHKSIIYISDDLDHDVSLVYKFQEKTAAYINENFPGVNEVEYFTDGCASQYKSKGYFKNLCNQLIDFKLKVTHSYFGTSHGKGQCDADGGTAKRVARKASLQRPLDQQIINADDFFQFCKEKLSDKFHFEFVSKSEVDPLRKNHQKSMDELRAVPGTRSFHFIKPEPGELIHMTDYLNSL